ncbi:MAG: hypothetical protein WB660_18270 [Candidatus Sulfotelmatobacter sp.]
MSAQDDRRFTITWKCQSHIGGQRIVPVLRAKLVQDKHKTAYDPNVLGSHFLKGIAEIRLELLANPDDWTATLTHQANEVVDRLKKASKAITSASGLVTKYRDRIQSLCDTAAPKKLSTPQPHEAEIAQAGD